VKKPSTRARSISPAASAAGDPSRLDWGRSGFSARARRVAFAFTEALLSDEDENGELIPARPEVCELAVGGLDQAVGNGSADLRRGFAVLAVAMEWLPLLLLFTPTRMSRLPLARRVAYLEALEASSIGWLSMLFIAFKVPLCIPAFEEPGELAATGFDRPGTASRRALPLAPSPAGSARREVA
jgi:hypothetical protein